MKVCLGDVVLLVRFPMECLSADACCLFDRVLKVRNRKRETNGCFLIPEKNQEARPQNTRNRLLLGRKEESADLLTTNSGSTTLLGRGNDDYGKHLLLPAVKRWQQQIRTLSQGQKIASLAIHKTRGCNILAGGTT
jgi:hypothetical protein